MHIDGLAASAATVVTSAGTSIEIAENALMMIHNPYMLTVGSADDHRTNAEALDRVRHSIITSYRWTSSRTEEELSAMMAAVTWMDADEAITNGFAHTKVGATPPSASAFDAPLAIATWRAPAEYVNHLRSFFTPASAALIKTDSRASSLDVSALYAQRNRPLSPASVGDIYAQRNRGTR